jgi:hypothetical protein
MKLRISPKSETVVSNLAVDRGVDEDFYGCGCPLLMEGRVDDARVGAQELGMGDRGWAWGDGPVELLDRPWSRCRAHGLPDRPWHANRTWLGSGWRQVLATDDQKVNDK